MTIDDSTGYTRDELLALPAVVDLVTAGRAWGLGRNHSYELARRGEFPCRVLKLGSRYRVVTEHLLTSLGIDRPARTAPEDSDGASRTDAPTATIPNDTHEAPHEHVCAQNRTSGHLRPAS